MGIDDRNYRRLQACLMVGAGYLAIALGVILIRLEAVRWGFILSAHAAKALTQAAIIHASAIVLLAGVVFLLRRISTTAQSKLKKCADRVR